MSISARTAGVKQSDEVQRRDLKKTSPLREKKDERDERRKVHPKLKGEEFHLSFIFHQFSSIVR